MKTFKEFLNEAFANTKEKNLSKSEIEALPVGTDFYYNGYKAKKVSDSKVEINYPMRPSTKVPISSLKESLTEAKYELENVGLKLMEQTQVNEAVSIDSQFMKMQRMIRDVKDAFNDVVREVKADTDMPARQYQSIVDKIEDHIELLRKELDKAQNELKRRY